MKVREVDASIKALVWQNKGFCPCAVERNQDTLCPCKAFREQDTPGLCHCGRFEKMEG